MTSPHGPRRCLIDLSGLLLKARAAFSTGGVFGSLLVFIFFSSCSSINCEMTRPETLSSKSAIPTMESDPSQIGGWSESRSAEMGRAGEPSFAVLRQDSSQHPMRKSIVHELSGRYLESSDRE